jgi:hypothetical protein
MSLSAGKGALIFTGVIAGLAGLGTWLLRESKDPDLGSEGEIEPVVEDRKHHAKEKTRKRG